MNPKPNPCSSFRSGVLMEWRSPKHQVSRKLLAGPDVPCCRRLVAPGPALAQIQQRQSWHGRVDKGAHVICLSGCGSSLASSACWRSRAANNTAARMSDHQIILYRPAIGILQLPLSRYLIQLCAGYYLQCPSVLILARTEVLSLFILPSAIIKGPRATQLGTAEFAINNAVQKDCSCILDHSFDAPFACAVSFHFPLHFPLHSPFLFFLPCLSQRWLRPSLASGPGTDVTLTSSEPGQLWRRHATRFYFRDSVIQGGEPGFRMRWFFPAGPCSSGRDARAPCQHNAVNTTTHVSLSFDACHVRAQELR